MVSTARAQTESLVGKLHEDFVAAHAAVLTHCSGINVEKITALRRDLRQKNIKFQIIKNTLAVRAIEGTPLAALKDAFEGPTGLAYTTKDAVALAKSLVAFAQQEERLIIRGGVLDGVLLDPAQVRALAEIPSREILLARLVGALASPYAGLVYALSGVLRKFVYALDAIRRKKEAEGSK